MSNEKIGTTEEVNAFAKALGGWKKTSFNDARTVQSFGAKIASGEFEPEEYATPLPKAVDCLKLVEGQVVWLNTKTGECLRVA